MQRLGEQMGKSSNVGALPDSLSLKYLIRTARPAFRTEHVDLRSPRSVVGRRILNICCDIKHEGYRYLQTLLYFLFI